MAIEPWTDKGLELAVDFHGTHQRPPHGVLSESHLDSLAVALFLAMAETFNEQLDLIVLDDVINSLDIEHRGRLAELLVTEFGGRKGTPFSLGFRSRQSSARFPHIPTLAQIDASDAIGLALDAMPLRWRGTTKGLTD